MALTTQIVTGLSNRPTTTWQPEIVTPAVEKEMTLDKRITFLAEKYGVKESSARAIIGCESEWSPDAIGYNRRKDGSVWSKDIGLMQINNYFHEEEAARMGLDIYKTNDNLEYGFYLFSKRGAKPWAASKSCHHIT